MFGMRYDFLGGGDEMSPFVPKSPVGLTILLFFTAVANCATMGYDSGMIGSISTMDSYNNYFKLEHNKAIEGLLQASMWMGGVIAVPFILYITDAFGRKATVVIAAAVCAVGVILQACAVDSGMFSVARIFIGIGSTLATAATILVGELLHKKWRSFVLGMFFSSYFVGSLVASGVCYGTSKIDGNLAWRIPSILQIVPSLCCLCALPFIPESPRWLIGAGKISYAKRVLAIYHGGDQAADSVYIDNYVKYIQATIETEAVDKKKGLFRVNEFFQTKANIHRFIIILIFGLMEELVGNFQASYYIGTVLDLAGVTNTQKQLQINIGLSCFQFACAIFGSYMLDVIGRRHQIFTGMAGMISSNFILGALIKYFGANTTNQNGLRATVAFMFVFNGFYAFSITPLTTAYATEILGFRLRATGTALFRLIDNSSGLVSSFVWPYGLNNIGWKFYIANGVWDLAYVVAIYFFWVETKGKSLEEINQIFGDGVDIIESQLEEYDPDTLDKKLLHDHISSNDGSVDEEEIIIDAEKTAARS